MNHRAPISQTFGDITIGDGARVIIGYQDGSTRETEDQLAERCKCAFQISEPSVDRDELVDFKGALTKGTCEWIRNDPAYQSLLQSDGSELLWISGGPGRGKTMLSIFLTKELESVVQDSPSLVLYVFCNEKDYGSEVAIMRSLLYQILKYRPSLARHATTKMEDEDRTKLLLSSRGDLWDIFGKFICDPELGPVYYLIDGLDECHHKSYSWLIRKFAFVFDKSSEAAILPASPFKVLVVSREIPGLGGYPRVNLETKTDAIDQDILRFIEANVTEIEEQLEVDEEFKDEIAKTLKERSDGRFLWIGFAIQELQSVQTTMEIRHILKSMPTGLDTVYSRILSRIESKWRDEIAKLLRWVSQVRHPLRDDQLADALDIEVQRVRDLVKLSRSLLIYGNQSTSVRPFSSIHGTHYHSTLYKPQERVIKLIHASVGDFLRVGPDEFRIEPEKVNYEIANRCLGQILINLSHSESMKEWPFFSEGPSTLSYTFFIYAIYYWVEHAKSCGKYITELFDDRNSFFMSQDPLSIRPKWWNVYYNHLCSPVDKVPLLHMCIGLGFPSWFHIVLRGPKSEGNNVYDEDCDGYTALYYAFKTMQKPIAQELIDRGARLINNNNIRKSPICIAFDVDSEMAQPYLKKALRNHWFNRVNWRSSRTLLLARRLFDIAIESAQWEKKVQMLLDNGYILNMDTALVTLYSQWMQRPVEINFFLEHCTDVNPTVVLSNIPPRPNSNEENVCGIMKQLLSHGADVNMPNHDGSTPIYNAIRSGALKTAKLLLENGAKVNRLCKFEYGQETAIYPAINNAFQFGTWPVQLLLDHGAIVNDDVLQYATQVWAPTKVLELLRQHHDANTYVRVDPGQAALESKN